MGMSGGDLYGTIDLVMFYEMYGNYACKSNNGVKVLNQYIKDFGTIFSGPISAKE